MNPKILSVVILFLSIALFQISCKQNSNGKTIVFSKEPIKIDSIYQIDIKSDSIHKSIIDFSNKYNSSPLWRYTAKLELQEAHLQNFNVLSNGDIVNVFHSGCDRFVLVLDKNGKELYRNAITLDEYSEYDFSESWILDNYKGGFTFLVRKEVNFSTKELFGNEKSENTRYDLEKMIFSASKKSYVSETVSIRRVLLEPLQNRGFDFYDNNFDFYNFRNKIFIEGRVKRKNGNEFPYIAMFDHDFKLLKLNVFEGYQNTYFYDFSLYRDGYYINGTKVNVTDLFCTKTIQRIIVDEDLKVIEDHSDKRTPYWDRFYREPITAEEKKIFDKEIEESSEEEIEKYAKQKNNTEYNTRGDSGTVISSRTFYSNTTNNCFYTIIPQEKVLFEKSFNDQVLWQIEIKFPKIYDPDVIIENSILIERTNGDIVLLMVIDNLSLKNYRSTVVFVINKQGRIIRQFEVLGTSNLIRAKEFKGNLIVNYTRYQLYIKKDWIGSSVFYSEAYPLD